MGVSSSIFSFVFELFFSFFCLADIINMYMGDVAAGDGSLVEASVVTHVIYLFQLIKTSFFICFLICVRSPHYFIFS